MAGVTLGTVAMSLVFNALATPAHPYFAMPFWWHMVAGGWAFGTVFMATDPVTSPFTERGKWIYGGADRRVRRAGAHRQSCVSRSR